MRSARAGRIGAFCRRFHHSARSERRSQPCAQPLDEPWTLEDRGGCKLGKRHL